MRFRVLLSVCLLFPQNLLAQQKLWVRSLYQPLEDFQVFVNTRSGLSYAEHQLKKARQKAKSFKIKEQLLTAQRFYLEGNQEKAKEHFLKISRWAYLADWDEEERRIFIYAFLRLAQMEKESEGQRAFLILAQDFFGFPITKKNYEDFDLFPPPLMENLQAIPTKSPLLTVNMQAIFPHHEILLLNGERVDKTKALKRFPAYYRLTALSSSHEPWSKKVNLSGLLSQKIITASLSEGACSQPQLKKPFKNLKVLLVPVADCPKESPFPLEGTVQAPAFFEPQPKESDKKTSQKSLWWLVGSAVLIVSLMFFLGLKEKEESDNGDYIW